MSLKSLSRMYNAIVLSLFLHKGLMHIYKISLRNIPRAIGGIIPHAIYNQPVLGHLQEELSIPPSSRKATVILNLIIIIPKIIAQSLEKSASALNTLQK